MQSIETERLRLRRFTIDDSELLMRLVNEPAWLENIGDRGLHSIEKAEHYLRSQVLPRYEKTNIGWHIIELKGSAAPAGICSLQQRTVLPAPDFGCALLADFTGFGYGRECVAALLEYARTELDLNELYGVVNPGNVRCRQLCERLGFQFSGLIQPAPEGKRFELLVRRFDE